MTIEVEPTLDGVAETLLWILRNRAEESKHPRSSFTDPWWFASTTPSGTTTRASAKTSCR